MSGVKPAAWPSYLALPARELRRRAEALVERYRSCEVCPRNCRVSRMQGELGACATRAVAAVASYAAHFGEEPPISGRRGSGTIFFANCNLRCLFCQNWQISHMGRSADRHEVPADRLAGMMLELQGQGCHNINLVSPTHVVPSIVEALRLAVDGGLRLPLVYNTNGYDSVETLRLLDGIVDIYMPDLKYADAAAGKRLSGIDDYPRHARAAIREMFRQVGELRLDEDGVALRGLLIRHLVLPGRLAGSVESLRWIREELSPNVSLSVMAQYYPANRAAQHPPLHRRVRYSEYQEVTDALEALGLEQGWVQSHAEAPDCYQPDFDHDQPFEQ